MELEVIERYPKPGERSWIPFESNRAFTVRWWNNLKRVKRVSRYIEVRTGGAEVARVELDEDVTFDDYIGAPALGACALEIQLIEVAIDRRREGIASQVVDLLVQHYPDRRLVAFSEDADDFWSSLGWTRYDHQEGWPAFRPLFMQSAQRNHLADPTPRTAWGRIRMSVDSREGAVDADGL